MEWSGIEELEVLRLETERLEVEGHSEIERHPAIVIHGNEPVQVPAEIDLKPDDHRVDGIEVYTRARGDIVGAPDVIALRARVVPGKSLPDLDASKPEDTLFSPDPSQ